MTCGCAWVAESVPKCRSSRRLLDHQPPGRSALAQGGVASGTADERHDTVVPLGHRSALGATGRRRSSSSRPSGRLHRSFRSRSQNGVPRSHLGCDRTVATQGPAALKELPRARTERAAPRQRRSGRPSLCLDQRWPVRTSTEVWPAQLHDVVLPEAHRANLVGAERVLEHEVSATRAREPGASPLAHGRILPNHETGSGAAARMCRSPAPSLIVRGAVGSRLTCNRMFSRWRLPSPA